MPCKIRRGNHGETCSSSGIRKTKYACIVEADESTRKRLEGTLHKDHEDHIAGKGINSLSHYHLVHKFIPMPEAIKIPEAKQQWRKNVEKLEAKTTPTLNLGFEDCSKLFDGAEFECIELPGDTQSTKSMLESCSMCGEPCS